MYDAMAYWKYAMLIFFSISIMFPDVRKINYAYRVLSNTIAPYFYSFLPVGLLMYMLYIASNKL